MPEREVLARFRTDQERRGLLRSTITRRDYSLRLLARTVSKSLFDIDTPELEKFLDGRGLTARSRYGWLSNLHAFYSWAIREGLTDHDPTEQITRPRLRRQLPRPIDPDDLAMAIREASPIMRAWLILGAYAGLRCAEIANLQRSDVLDSGEEPMLRIVGKGQRERLVPMHPVVLEALKQCGMPKRGHLFKSTQGSFTPGQISRLGGAHFRACGIDASMHMLRHYFATQAYRGSHDLRAVQELLGHSSPTTTAVYTAWDPVAAVRAVLSIPPPAVGF